MSDDKRLERIESKVDDLDDHLASIDITLKAQHIILDEHVRRTEALEKMVAPMQKSMYMAKGAIALISLLALLAGIIEVFRK